jgi:hypothetical protein
VSITIGDKKSVLLDGLSGFWQRFFKDVNDLESYYQASETYLGQIYLDLMSSILNIGLVDAPIFNKEAWKLLVIKETDLNFRQGVTEKDNRYIYALPDAYTQLSSMQNTIFNPSIVLEKDLNFDTEPSTSSIAFVNDLFRMEDDTGDRTPLKGIAWREQTVEVGNVLCDNYQRATKQYVDYYAQAVERGDILRLLATCSTLTANGVNGVVTISSGVVRFSDTDVGVSVPGDVIEIYRHSSGLSNPAADRMITNLIIKTIVNDDTVIVESDTNGIPTTNWTQLYWRLWKADYIAPGTADYEVDTIDIKEGKLVGNKDNPYPTYYPPLLVYSIVRVPALNEVTNYAIPFVAYTTGSYVLSPPIVFNLSSTEVDYGSVTVNARKASDINIFVEEGVDYVIDYMRGTLTQLVKWHSMSPGTVSYTFKQRVFWSANGTIKTQTTGIVRQLTLWSPSVDTDDFSMWYNYGSMVNKFDLSSEVYKSFLRGILYLYVSGPILERIEAALNLSLGFPVVRSDGEVLVSYFDGIDAQGIYGTMDSTTASVQIPTAEYTFTDLDYGAKLILTDSLHASNNGVFYINNIDFVSNSALLEASNSFVTAHGVAWILSRDYKKKIITTGQTYLFDYTTPMRTDVTLPESIGQLTFRSFEPLTDAFKVTDYVEDPIWWHNKYIPSVLWSETPAARRLATTKLYDHVFGAGDLACYGDPGLYVGADEFGTVMEPRDGGGNLVPLKRHSAAFLLFDRFLKFHMFYIRIHGGIELDAQFRDDLDDLILITKPAYAYPYVVPDEIFQDLISLSDLFKIANVKFNFGEDADNRKDSFVINNNLLIVGDLNFPVRFGDYFVYNTLNHEEVTPVPSGAVVPGTMLNISDVMPPDSRLISLSINATRNSKLVLEGIDYLVNWKAYTDEGDINPNQWVVTALTTWDSSASITVSGTYVVFVAESSVDTTVGHTPMHYAGENPAYIRSTAIDPESDSFYQEWRLLRSEHVDRGLQLVVVDDGGSYNY